MKKKNYHILLYTIDILFWGLSVYIDDFLYQTYAFLPLYFLSAYVFGAYYFRVMPLFRYLFVNVFSLVSYLFLIFTSKFFVKDSFLIGMKTIFTLSVFFIFYKYVAYQFLYLLIKKIKIPILFLYDSSINKDIDPIYIRTLKTLPFYHLKRIVNFFTEKKFTTDGYKVVVEDNLLARNPVLIGKDLDMQKMITFSGFVEQNLQKIVTGPGVYNENVIRGINERKNILNRIHDIFVILVNVLITALLLPILLFFILVIPCFNFFLNKGPLFYKQKRVGFSNEEYFIYKFRTMVVDAEKLAGVQMATKKDKRITPLGSFLRKFRIDELPQIFSVIQGKMNVIGPRPERMFFVKKIVAKNSLYLFRHYIKPGITGWAQVQYKYGSSLEDSIKKLEYDFYYIRYRSVIMDIRIILKTIQTVLFSRGV